MGHPALVLVLLGCVSLLAPAAQAKDLRIPDGMMLCHTLEATASPSHPGCWLAWGGQRVEIVAVLPTCAQLRIWSSTGAESMIVYARRPDADRLQMPAAR